MVSILVTFFSSHFLYQSFLSKSLSKLTEDKILSVKPCSVFISVSDGIKRLPKVMISFHHIVPIFIPDSDFIFSFEYLSSKTLKAKLLPESAFNSILVSLLIDDIFFVVKLIYKIILVKISLKFHVHLSEVKIPFFLLFIKLASRLDIFIVEV